MPGRIRQPRAVPAILVVEDSRVQAESIKYLLDGRGYAVTVAYSGDEAIEKLDSGEYSLIISDIVMPGMNGYELCREIKSDSRYSDIPVILLTELSEPDDIIRGLQSGADNFITKPYTDENLLARIEHLRINSELRRRGNGELTIDVFFRGEKYVINSARQQILDLLISVFETAVEKNLELIASRESFRNLAEQLTVKNNELNSANSELKEMRNTLEERVKTRTEDRDKQIERHLVTIEALKKTEEMYRTLTERMTDILWTTDIRRRLTYISPSVERILGFAPDERIQQKIDDILTPQSLALLRKMYIEEAENEKNGADPDRIMRPELYLYHKNGSIRVLENSITIIRDPGGNPAGFQGMSRDITEKKEMKTRLRETEEKYRAIIEAINECVWEVDFNGVYTYVSPKMLMLLGYQPEELIGKTPFDLMPPKEALRGLRFFERLQKNPAPFGEFENINIRKDDGQVVLETSGSPFFSESGELLGFRGVDRDITKRKEYEKAIRQAAIHDQSMKRISEIFNMIQDESVYKEVLDELLKISESSDGFFGYIDSNGTLVVPSLLGKIMDECRIENKTFKFSIGAQTCSIWTKSVMEKRTLFSNSPLTGKPEGHIEIKNDICVPVVNNEKVIGIINVANRNGDYTDEDIQLMESLASYISPIMYARIERDRKEEERQLYEDELVKHKMNLEALVETRTAELKNERDKTDAIIRSVADGIIVTDMQQRVILMNSPAEELLGVRFRNIRNEPIDFVIQEHTLREKLRYVIDKLKAEYEFDIVHDQQPNDIQRIIHGKTSVTIDREGSVLGTVTILSDVTAIREIDRMKTEFISTAAHEFRTPLTSILGFSEILLMRDDLKEKESKKFLGYIYKQSVKLAQIVADLLDIARIESGKGFSINKQRCLVREIFFNVIPYFEKHTLKHEFVTDLPEKPVVFFADVNLMEQVLKNLLSNAIKYSPDGGKIKVSAREDSDFIVISVEDHGIGMTPEQSARIFEKFYRANSSDSAPEGTGLGMTIVKYIVEMHGGKIWLESSCGEGTKIFFTVPLKLF